MGSLVFDEMPIEDALHFNSQTFNFYGFIDTQSETSSTNMEESQLVKHGLVFFFDRYMASWIEPFSVFA